METKEEQQAMSGDIKIICSYSKGSDVLAMVYAGEWFKGINIPFPFEEKDYVVCRWTDYSDGEKSNIEGKVTIAVLKKHDDAKIVYQLNK